MGLIFHTRSHASKVKLDSKHVERGDWQNANFKEIVNKHEFCLLKWKFLAINLSRMNEADMLGYPNP